MARAAGFSRLKPATADAGEVGQHDGRMNTYANHPNESARAAVARALADYYTELCRADAGTVPAQRFSLAKVFTDLQAGSGVRDGIERELCSGLATIVGRQHDPDKPMIPWPCLAVRDLTASTAAAGGYLAPTTPQAPVDVLRGFSVAVDAGITVLDGLVGNVTIPTVATSATAAALPTEATQATESTPALGQASMTPKALAGYVEFSRTLDRQVPSLNDFLSAHLLRVVGELLDKQLLYGNGALGQLSGIMSAVGITSQAGASLSWAGVRSMRKACINAGAREDRLAWIGAGDTHEVLSGRERATGSGFIWTDNGIGGRPAHPTKVAQAGSLLVGEWASVVLGLWGGPVVEFNPYANFTAAIKGARVIVNADAVLTNPAAFAVSTSVT